MSPQPYALGHALAYARHGWAVLPLKPASKAPATRRGFKDASTDASAIRDWFEAHPDAGVGIYPGSAHLLVLDVDDKEGKTGSAELEECEARHGALPATLVQRTPSGGRHLLFALPEGVELGNASPFKDIDVRSHAGYVAAEPTRLDVGSYSFDDWDVLAGEVPEIAQTPAWLIELLRAPGRAAPARPVQAPTGGASHVAVAADVIADLRSALNVLDADAYDVWVRTGCQLVELGNVGRELWLTWSQLSSKFDPAAAAQKWASFRGERTGHAGVFSAAQAVGWLNPRSRAAHVDRDPPAWTTADMGSLDEPVERAGSARHGVEATSDDGQAPEVEFEWAAPVLPGSRPTPDIAAGLLPSWMGDMAAAVAASTQTPPALAVLLGLAVLATALQRRFEVSPHGDEYREPLALFLAVLMPSGSRKSSVFSAMTAPIVLSEKRARGRARARIASVESRRLVAKKRIERLTSDAAKTADAAELESIRAAIQAEQEGMPDEAHAPRLFTTNATAESLQAMLAEQLGRIAVLADEGDVLAVLGGLYSGGKAALDVLLQGHAGTAIRVDRAGRTAHIDRPALTIGLAIQPGTMAELAGSKRFRDSGLLARFLVAMPASNLGKRDVRLRLPIPPAVSQAYETKLLELLDTSDELPEKPTVLGFSDAARDLWLDMAEYVEHGLGAGGALDAISDWAGKLPGAVARIAALLELAETGLQADTVNEDTMRRAVQLGELLTSHAHAMFGLLGADAIDMDAQAVMAWVRAQQLGEFTAQQCRKAMSGRFAKPDRMAAALQRLQASHVLREVVRPNPGTRSSRLFLVNPAMGVMKNQKVP